MELLPGSRPQLRIDRAVGAIWTARTGTDILARVHDAAITCAAETGYQLTAVEVPWTTRDALMVRLERDLCIPHVSCNMHGPLTIQGVAITEEE